jgi:energy-converting hydrogenase Eha subunit E
MPVYYFARKPQWVVLPNDNLATPQVGVGDVFLYYNAFLAALHRIGALH